MAFRDRTDAGKCLAGELAELKERDAVILGLPRGGVPVAFEVAEALDAPLDVIVVRKLGLPFQPELAMGAIGEGGVRVVNDEVVRMTGVEEQEFAAVERRERAELERRAEEFRRGRRRVTLQDKVAIIVDDGIATGSTARAACQVARASGATHVILAVPVAPPASISELASVADEVVCLETPEPFFAVGQWYRDFTAVSDKDVTALLHRADEGHLGEQVSPSVPDPPIRDEEVRVDVGPVVLAGHLTVPEPCRGLVVFAHGSGSSRHSPRNRFVAQVLNRAALGTLLFDLLTLEEQTDRALVFDIELLAERLVAVTGWLRSEPEGGDLPIGYFGASTGAGAALWAAAQPDSHVAAVVSRGGRPDLAGPVLDQVRAPTLLIVGGRDDVVLDLNRQALARLRCESELTVVPGATHLFEEPGTLETAADLAAQWFASHVAPAGQGLAGRESM